MIAWCEASSFASIWLTEWHSYDRAVLKRFGVGKEEKIAGYIHIGHDSGPREDRARPKLADIVTTFEGSQLISSGLFTHACNDFIAVWNTGY